MNLKNYIHNTVNQLFRNIRYPIRVFEKEITDIQLSSDDIKIYRFQKLKKDFFSMGFKNREDTFKYLFYFLILGLLVILPFISTRTGISEAELHAHHQAEALYQYYANGDTTILSDTHAINHPQMIDFLCYCITHWFHIDSVYHFRHIVGSLFAWMLILLLGTFLMNLFHWRAAFFGTVFLSLSPHFLGQSFGNLADIPFAFFYLLGIFQLYSLLGEFPTIKWKRLLLITLSILLSTSIHCGGYVLLHYLFLFTILIFFIRNPWKKILTRRYIRNLLILFAVLAGITCITYLFNLLIPTYSHHHLAWAPSQAISHATMGESAKTFLWNGQMVDSSTLSWQFILRKMQITVPLVVIIGLFIHFVFLKTISRSIYWFNECLILFTTIFPLWSIHSGNHNLSEGWSIYLMIYPLFVLLAAAGYEGVLRKVDDRYTNVIIVSTIVMLIIMPLRHVILCQHHPNTYFNEISGGIHNAHGKYAIDPEQGCNQQVCKWLIENAPFPSLDATGRRNPYLVATNGNEGCDYFFRDLQHIFRITHTPWEIADSTLHWDYYISFIDHHTTTPMKDRISPNDTIIYQLHVERQPIACIIQRRYPTNDSITQDTSLIDNIIK